MLNHLSAGTLRAYRDDGLDPDRRAAVRRHLAACARCGGLLARVEGDEAWAARALQPAVAGGDPGAVDAAVAWRRLAGLRGGPAGGGSIGEAPEAAGARGTGRSAPAGRRWTPARTALSGGVLLALVALGLQPVRAAVGKAFSVFQLRQAQVVTVSPSDLTQIRQALTSGAGRVNIRGLASVSVTPPHVRPAPVSLQEARQLLPFPLRVPAAPPQGYALARVEFQPTTTVAVAPNVAGINRLLASMGSSDRLPASLEGQTVLIRERAAVALVYAASALGGGAPVRVLEASDPIVRVPQGVDVSAVREAFLGLPFLPPDLRQQLAAIADWQHTAVLPRVSGVDRAVAVNGVTGVFTPPSRPGGPSVLAWFSGRVVHAVTGPLTQAQALAVAGSLR